MIKWGHIFKLLGQMSKPSYNKHSDAVIEDLEK